MKSPKNLAVILAFIFLTVVETSFSARSRPNAPLRNFEFTYITKIPAVPADAKVSHVWIPLPQSDAFQSIRDLKIEAPFAYNRQREPEYGNEYLHAQIPANKLGEPTEVRVSFQAIRHEHRVALRQSAESTQ